MSRNHVELLIAYGQDVGLSREAALEVVTSWQRETALSVADDEALFRVPLRFRAIGNEWRPARLVRPEELARTALPLINRMDQDQEAP